MTQEDTTTTTTTSSNKSVCTNDELIELIRAVKFSTPDASIRAVHDEISTKMATLDPQYDFLSQVKLNQVKKCWKKAISNSKPGTVGGGEEHGKESSVKQVKAALAGVDTQTKEEAEEEQDSNVLQLYTVGDGTIQTLAENYTREAAAKAAAADDAALQKERTQEDDKYVHCFLDVPADRSGKKPYQALINFNGSEPSSESGSSSKKSKNKKKGRVIEQDIVKIQTAVAPPGMGKIPMLLYNQSRSARTFIHPEEGQDSDYDKIEDWIANSGTSGVLQFQGGMKAYFFAKITRRERGEQDIVSIDISQLAPAQNW